MRLSSVGKSTKRSIQPPRQRVTGWNVFSHVRRVWKRKTDLASHYSVCDLIGNTFTDRMVTGRSALKIHQTASPSPDFEHSFMYPLPLTPTPHRALPRQIGLNV